MMKSWCCPWFPFVLELLRESAAKSPSPLANFGVALFCCPEGAETGKPRRGEPRLRGRPWGFFFVLIRNGLAMVWLWANITAGHVAKTGNRLRPRAVAPVEQLRTRFEEFLARTTRGRKAAKVRVLITRGEQSEAPS